MLKPGTYEVEFFRGLPGGDSPFLVWLQSLSIPFKERIMSRIGRMQRGNFGDFKPLGENFYELRLDFGPGFRVYFGHHEGRMVIILAGGDKSTQSKDIKRARQFWKTYLEANS